ncbi:lipopolysaccharide 1,2-glucosyltransferase [Pectobacterium atrosepticum SCRI1043]|uniref:Lipopolysaccharide 1,2-glucosyltransferase n=1 Tax=Pectobacterium atrosepticum (strain SCRI 1043 / ATCC BAA-672) TaxID=218491 RepID=Q6DAU5_PECAS|nr:glycosyltransferase [Pectobacterium atrosepticum]GKV87467.1 LPS 1,2-glucosyltransferase [Pectobacterium carotovorum subsp. carotovorum]AIA69179.1 lipopolysaccharide 1,2-glucosyltransferase [Pectobacterium atrosepticum]AIK12083.1 lipopolysaccharide 1,2-glucosyltransferase [Pectobacterium atrosepticum]ATY89030.1 lipopolysaccharide 1,2-glucosyltransferase [Pectobacterium atrosepticum]MBL0893383.1 lipopolysaccharide 1,2-glucosyltransferase [Pectobacterium atrosepticum]
MVFSSHIDVLSVFEKRHQSIADNNTLNVAYGIDKNYAVGCGISVASILINNNINFTFHIFSDDFDDEFIKKIEIIAEKFKTKIVLYKINSEMLKTLPCTDIWSHAMYFRLLAFSHLSDKISSLLYLDADVMCKGSLAQLSTLDTAPHVAAVIRDLPETQKKSASRLKITTLEGEYFNSGVLFVNLKIWNELDLTQKIFEKLINGDEAIQYPDQDVMNILLHNNVIFLPREYNTIYSIKNELNDPSHKKYKEVIKDDTVLIHYTGITKPWHKWANYPSTSYFQHAQKESPWSFKDLKDADTFVEMKKKYKHLLKKGKYLSGLICAFKYLINKHYRKNVN